MMEGILNKEQLAKVPSKTKEAKLKIMGGDSRGPLQPPITRGGDFLGATLMETTTDVTSVDGDFFRGCIFSRKN